MNHLDQHPESYSDKYCIVLYNVQAGFMASTASHRQQYTVVLQKQASDWNNINETVTICSAVQQHLFTYFIYCLNRPYDYVH